MTTHKAVEEVQYYCVVCGMVFDTQDDLERHWEAEDEIAEQDL